MWLGKDPAHSLSSSKDTRLKVVFVPTESSWAGRSERCAIGVCWALPILARRRGAMQNTVLDYASCKGSGLGVRQSRTE